MSDSDSFSVRPERTGWRDQEISKRHREWGFNCPAVDLDFLMVEYNFAKPVGLIEYKHHTAQFPNFLHPTYKALTELADSASLPFLVAFYWPGIWAFRIYPVNDIAKQHYGQNQPMTERQFVYSLYRLRRLVLVQQMANRLSDVMPPGCEDWEI